MKKVLSRAKGICLLFEYAPYLIESAGSKPKRMRNILDGLAPFTAYSTGDSGLKLIGGPDKLYAEFDEVANSTDARYQGGLADFVLVKNMQMPRNLVAA